MSYPRELLEDDLGGLLAPAAQPRSRFAALGQLLGGGIDREGAFLKGQLQSARTQEAIDRARLARSNVGINQVELDALTRLSTERPDVTSANYNPLDLILGKRGSDFAAASQGLLHNQEFDNREVLASPLGDALSRQAASDSIKGEFQPYRPVGEGTYYDTLNPDAGLSTTPVGQSGISLRTQQQATSRQEELLKQDQREHPEKFRNNTYGGLPPPPRYYRYKADGSGDVEFIPGGPADPGNPRNRVRPTADQSNAAGYYDRMVESEKLIGNFAPSYKDFVAFNYVLDGGPTTAAIAQQITSDEGQSYYQAAADWVRAKLRKESGAAIGEREMLQEIRTYFPLPGEGPEIIAQKAAARATAVNAIRRTGAPALALPTPPAAPSEPRSFASEAEAEAAAASGALKAGQKITINGVTGTWQ